MTDIPVITVDGPSGSGKGTLALKISTALGWHYLDSGAIYRTLALACEQAQIAPHETDRILTLIETTLDISFQIQEKGHHLSHAVLLQQKDVTHTIRQESTALLASEISSNPSIRKALLVFQRSYQSAPGLVTDGRDMGTIVFPDAPLKFFLTASAEIRAQRRFDELKARGQDVSLPALLQQIEERDRRDQTRTVSPLRPAEDAVCIDSSDLNPEAVFELASKYLRGLPR